MNPETYLKMADTEARHWWFVGRRAIISHLIHTFNLSTNARILEIGSGTGGNLLMLSHFGQVNGLEMDATARSITSEKTGERFDIRPGFCPTDMPFAGEKFDLICLFDVLEHIDEDVETLIALKALLAEKGRILLTVPAYRWLWSPHDEDLHHKRRYSITELRQKIAASGLYAMKISYFNTLLFPLAVIAKVKDKLLNSSSASGCNIPPYPVNQIFTALFSKERTLVEKTNLPFGVSLLGILQAEQP